MFILKCIVILLHEVSRRSAYIICAVIQESEVTHNYRSQDIGIKDDDFMIIRMVIYFLKKYAYRIKSRSGRSDRIK